MTDSEYIPFNVPCFAGNELDYIKKAIEGKKISGNGNYTKACHVFFQKRYGFGKCLMTSSCTDALEMSAILADINPGDEVIMPSYTFVSTANAFVLRGATIRFIDSRVDHPGMDEALIAEQINARTKAIVAVHYAGVACDMDKINRIAKDQNLLVIEDAAQAIDAYYNGKALGGIGDLAAFSFHETKNIISGEGGLLTINKPRFESRSEIIWEKGTNRAAFWRGEVDKYGWVDMGSSFLPSDITAAFLLAQLESIDAIQSRRLSIWNQYNQAFADLRKQGIVGLPVIPEYATNNAHMYYLVCRDLEERSALIGHLNKNKINAVFHYQSLHESQYYKPKHDGRDLPNSDRYTNCLLRLPLHLNLTDDQVSFISDKVIEFYKQGSA